MPKIFHKNIKTFKLFWPNMSQNSFKLLNKSKDYYIRKGSSHYNYLICIIFINAL